MYLLSPSSRGDKSEIKLPAGWFLLCCRGWGGTLSHACLGFRWCWQSLASLGLRTHHPDLCLRPHVAFFLCACLQICHFYKGRLQWSHLNLINSVKTLSPKLVTLWGTRYWHFNIEILQVHSSTHNSCQEPDVVLWNWNGEMVQRWRRYGPWPHSLTIQ